MNDPGVKQWTTICQLTDPAMDALVEVERFLMAMDGDKLTPHEFRALLWVRCSLACLYGLRADEAMVDVDWFDSLLLD